jgi:hypothetical protein
LYNKLIILYEIKLISTEELSLEQYQLITNMENLGAVTDGDFFLIFENETLNKFIEKYPNEFKDAKKITMPTAKQIKFCEHLMNQGAPHENKIYDSMSHADKYIQSYKHLKKTFHMTSLRADEWGGVLNC